MFINRSRTVLGMDPFFTNRSLRTLFAGCIVALLWLQPDPCVGSCLGVAECDCEAPPGVNQPIINCRSKQLTAVPVFTSSSAQYSELTLADNRIQTITERAFNGLYFTRLDLSGNQITTVATLAFNGVEAVLKELILSLASTAEFPVVPLSALHMLELLEVRNYSKATLPTDALLRLTALKELRIVSGRLRNLTSDTFRGQQASLLALNLQQNQLGRVPTSALAPLVSLQTLDLSANQITQLPANAFSGSISLRSIVLDLNPLQNNVDPRAFADISLTLQSLSFLSCQLGDRSLDAIKPLEQLTTLNLRQNTLTNLPTDLFTRTNQLHYLILDSNRLTSLNSALFLNISSSLLTLELRDNPFTNLPSDTFSTLTSLVELSLEGVTSLRLTQDSFVQQKRFLKVLNLDRSGVGDSVWPALAPLGALETLTLSSVSLSSVPDFAFQFNDHLQNIDLSSNQISSITQLTLIGLENSLVSLKLNGNPITTLDHCLFNQFKYVDYTKLILTGMRLQCDCGLRWLYQKIQPLDAQRRSTIRWNCSNGRLLSLLSESDFGCGSVTDAPCVTVQRTTLPDFFQYPIVLRITNQTSDSLKLTWTVDSSIWSSILGFTISRQTKSDGKVQTVPVDGSLREYTLGDLDPSTEYEVCILMDAGPDYKRQNKTCAFGGTMAGTGSSSDEMSEESLIGIIVGSVVGGVVLIATIVVGVVFFSRHKRNREEQKTRELRRQSSREMPAATFAAYSAAAAKGFAAEPEIPQVGSGSKRYTRNPQSRSSSTGASSPPYYNSTPTAYPTKQNVRPETGRTFSREETDKILTILTAMRSSTSSAANDSRYVAKPNATGHQNVAFTNDERKNGTAGSHHYEVIPGEQEHDYYNAPLDSVV